VLGLAAFGLILPGITSTVAGIAVLVATVAAQLVLARREQSPAVATAD